MTRIAGRIFVLCALAVALTTCATLRDRPEPPGPTTATYSEAVVRKLGFLWRNVQEVEFGFCGYGTIDGDTAHVEDVALSDILKAVPDTIWQRCPSDALGTGHSHRAAHGVGACGFSLGDLYYMAVNRHRIGWVVCAGPSDSTFAVHMLTRAQALKHLQKQNLAWR